MLVLPKTDYISHLNLASWGKRLPDSQLDMYATPYTRQFGSTAYYQALDLASAEGTTGADLRETPIEFKKLDFSRGLLDITGNIISSFLANPRSVRLVSSGEALSGAEPGPDYPPYGLKMMTIDDYQKYTLEYYPDLTPQKKVACIGDRLYVGAAKFDNWHDIVLLSSSQFESQHINTGLHHGSILKNVLTGMVEQKLPADYLDRTYIRAQNAVSATLFDHAHVISQYYGQYF